MTTDETETLRLAIELRRKCDALTAENDCLKRQEKRVRAVLRHLWKAKVPPCQYADGVNFALSLILAALDEGEEQS